eukprot:gene23167-31487_t
MSAITSDFQNNTFETLGLNDDIVRGVRDIGFEMPGDMLPQVVENFQLYPERDLLVINRNGTGKTSAFAISLLNQIDLQIEACQAIILTRTRESAYHIADQLSRIGKYTKIKTLYLLAGVPRRDLLRNLQEDDCTHIVVGTPGITNDFVLKKHLDISNLRNLIIDDFSLFSWFPQESFFDELLQLVPVSAKRSIIWWSVNIFMGSTNRQVLNYFLRDPIKIIPKYSDTRTLDRVKQYYIADNNGCTNESKLVTLLDLFSTFTALHQTCIYCKDRDTVEWLIARMDSVSHSSFRDLYKDSTKTSAADQTNVTAVSAIYPEMDLDERRAIVKSLRNCQLRALTTTFAGGISGGCSHHIYDISAISQVILFDLPASAEEYLLLVGRSIPFGKPTIVINFVPAGDESSFQSRLLKEVQMQIHS